MSSPLYLPFEKCSKTQSIIIPGWMGPCLSPLPSPLPSSPPRLLQLRKNGRADVLIQDLYVENGHLLKALKHTEQQQHMVEKKNYLLEQKISSLGKIMRDLGPAQPSPASYHSKCSWTRPLSFRSGRGAEAAILSVLCVVWHVWGPDPWVKHFNWSYHVICGRVCSRWTSNRECQWSAIPFFFLYPVLLFFFTFFYELLRTLFDFAWNAKAMSTLSMTNCLTLIIILMSTFLLFFRVMGFVPACQRHPKAGTTRMSCGSPPVGVTVYPEAITFGAV